MMRPSSLRGKLAMLVAGFSIIAALCAGSALAWRDLASFRQHTSAEASMLSAIVADQAGAAVMLGDARAAREILGSLHADDDISNAGIYNAAGACFAEFARAGQATCPPRQRDGAHAENGALVMVRPVMAGGERVGTLMVRIEVPSAAALLRGSLSVVLGIVFLILLMAAVLMASLEARVSSPVMAMARVAQRMAESHIFSQRVPVSSTDEVGVLARSFNLMLDEIERRDAELARHRRQLEEEVAERSHVNRELRAAKERAEDAARLKSEFLANMSHEIRTPMNGVLGMISLVLDQCGDAEQREQLRAAQQAGRALTAILNDILDLSKIEADKLHIEDIEFDLPTTIRECLRTFDVATREKGLALRVDLPPACPEWVRGDPVRLRQVLMNLVGNAVKFTMRGEVGVVISVHPANIVRIEVRDTGVGIAGEKLDLIFEPFTQADGSHTRRFGGSGLGLAITRRLVHLMQGRLWAESQPGHGSSFFIELPLEPCAAPDNGSVAGQNQAANACRNLRVLVAEDNAINQKVVCAMLRRQGWTVVVAGDGREACQCFSREPFDVILMDVQMPEMDGLEATALIRDEERRRGLPPVPIIALTAHAFAAQHEQCMKQGMSAVITKPVDLRTLIQTVVGLIDRAPAPAGELTPSA